MSAATARQRDGAHLLGLTLALVGASMLVLPGAVTPTMDDWTYAWSVEEWVRTGQLRLLDWSIHYPIAQIFWAVPFAQLFGFSFVTLHVSTLVLAWLGLVAFFLMLRLDGVSRPVSSLATLLLFLQPPVFLLSQSFMTDVPFLSVMNVVMLAYALWVARGRRVYLAVGRALVVVAFLIRQIAAFTALVPLVYWLVVARRHGRRPRIADVAVAIAPLLVIVLSWAAIQASIGTTSIYASKLSAMQETFLSVSWWLSGAPWRIYLAGAGHVVISVSFLLSPVALPLVLGRSRRALALALAVVAVLSAVKIWTWGATDRLLDVGDLAGTLRLLPGAPSERQTADWGVYVVTAIALASAVALVATLIDRVRDASAIGLLVLTNAALQFAAIEVLWLYHDRYYLPLLPGLVYLVVRSRPRPSPVMIATLAVLTVVSISGAIDHFRLARTVTSARAWLLSEGAAPHEIDAGYAVNGWWLYAHRENLPPDADPASDVPSVTTRARAPYSVASSPLPAHEVLRVVPFRSWWTTVDRLYVLKRLEAEAATSDHLRVDAGM
jgi:4-amino-4-deoxy-L-arabinose transferase-like glycosyltransferase